MIQYARGLKTFHESSMTVAQTAEKSLWPSPNCKNVSCGPTLQSQSTNSFFYRLAPFMLNFKPLISTRSVFLEGKGSFGLTTLVYRSRRDFGLNGAEKKPGWRGLPPRGFKGVLCTPLCYGGSSSNSRIRLLTGDAGENPASRLQRGTLEC